MSETKLYEFEAWVRYGVVVSATSEKEAWAEVKDMEDGWHMRGELLGVTSVDLVDVRDGDADEAHIITDKDRGEA